MHNKEGPNRQRSSLLMRTSDFRRKNRESKFGLEQSHYEQAGLELHIKNCQDSTQSREVVLATISDTYSCCSS